MATTCSQCGAAIQDDSASCPQCAPAAPSAEIQPALAAPFSKTLLDDTSHLEGIGGWLILVAIGLVLGPIVLVSQMMINLVPVLFKASLQPFLQSHPAVYALIVGEVATNLIMVALLFWINYLFFTRKGSFPSFMIFYLFFQLVIAFADFIAARTLLPVAGKEGAMFATRTLMAVAVWVPYLLISRRVKATFVR